MREKLAAQNDQRKTFRATFSRIGKKKNYQGYSEDTILFTNVVDVATNEKITDHVWFTYSKSFESLNANLGDVIEFDARIKAYKKGYVNKALGFNQRREDFKLSHPTKIRLVKK
jgi:hypothetical protein